MSIRELSTELGHGLLLQDPRCGSILLDCGAGVAAAAAFAGVPLDAVRHVLLTGTGPDCLDPGLGVCPGVFALTRTPPDGLLAAVDTLPAGLRPIRLGAYEVAWLVEVSRGWLLHCRHHTALPDDAVDQIAAVVGMSRVWVSVPLSPAVSAQLRGDESPTSYQPARWPRRVLVLGGARSGKSRLAEELLGDQSSVTYLATGATPDGSDLDWAERVAVHQRRRPSIWATVESTDVEGLLAIEGDPVLLDCLGTWLTWVLDESGSFQREPDSAELLAARLDSMVRAWVNTRRSVVAVSNEVGSGVVPATHAGRVFRDQLGPLNAAIAAESDEVWLVTAGLGRRLR